ncbi:MAG: 2-amino-4-hydroxy-6-hydroxymethyldihydropteridine diphosphokinase [Proteobacteria bacterium]|nr:2-amino-4-hydroxy-6-hydroxymethyldihydropteridine diphosphokinase [Cystobacterineae bacterium]MCL2314007.1 2-amino-4-hydroxy-6-hydroxymethyldihydropteridine diphosphokinase [Pseudomonadota bacterium]
MPSPPTPLKHSILEAARPGLPEERVFVALGSNLGEREGWLRFALEAFEAKPGLRLLCCSPVEETQAVVLPHHPPGPPYLNAVAELRCVFSPLELLVFLLGLEEGAGRKRGGRWEARTLDLDILCFGDRHIGHPRLEVPHPRLHLRAFVLSPWAQIAPGLKVPGQGLSIAELYARMA